MDGMLSQDEINALLNGMNADSPENAETPEGEQSIDNANEVTVELSDTEKDAVGEISNISMGSAATTLSSLLNQKVNITTPSVSIANWDELAEKYDRPCVMLQISYKEGLAGNNVLILKEKDVKIITDLMMGGSGQVNDDDPLGELHLSAIGEAMNQMMGTAATSMSSMFNRKIDISPPTANLIELYSDQTKDVPDFLQKSFVKVAFRMQSGDLIDSEIMQLYPIEFAHDLINMFHVEDDTKDDSVSNSSAQSEPIPVDIQQHEPTNSFDGQNMNPGMGMNQMGMNPGMGMNQMGMNPGMGMNQMGMNPGMGMNQMGMNQMGMQYATQPDVNVQSASFQPFSNDLASLTQKENIDLIMDVPLEVTVELGRTTKSIKDILEFSPGTIVELNKIAGESVDVLVNGKFVAKGEVVVIEESFGVRITEIIK